VVAVTGLHRQSLLCLLHAPVWTRWRMQQAEEADLRGMVLPMDAVDNCRSTTIGVW
jgi:hypothetical protein